MERDPLVKQTHASSALIQSSVTSTTPFCCWPVDVVSLHDMLKLSKHDSKQSPLLAVTTIKSGT